MPIYIGSNQLVKRYVGAQEVLRSYVGSRLVWGLPSYPLTGTWAGGAVPSGNTIYGTHTITQAGTFTITWSADFTTVTSGSLPGAKFRVNGTGLWTSGQYLSSPGNSTANGTRALAAGDVVNFHIETEAAGVVASGGTWTITKN